MAIHFFACNADGSWHYRYELYTEEQVKDKAKHYLSTGQWVECMFCDLHEELKACENANALMPREEAIKLKLKKMNDVLVR